MNNHNKKPYQHLIWNKKKDPAPVKTSLTQILTMLQTSYIALKLVLLPYACVALSLK
jgi:hypothetical protein